MGHYASDFGPPPDYAAEYQANEERIKQVWPLIQSAWLKQLAAEPNQDEGMKVTAIWERVAQATREALPPQSVLYFEESDIRNVFFLLVSQGLIAWTDRVYLTASGREEINKEQK